MEKEIVLAVDIGGTNTKLGYVDREGNVLSHSTILTEADKPSDNFFTRLKTEAQLLLGSIKQDVNLRGVGIGAPNGNYYKGTIEQPPNLSWNFVDVVSTIKQWYDVPVAVTNDANAAALGEMLFGCAKGMKHFIEITLGTGVGSGIVVDGALVYGHDGYAGELGHTVVDPEGRLCGCGKKGCLETYASANGIRRTAEELKTLRNMPSILNTIPFEQLTAKLVYEAAQQNDVIALETFELTGKYLGMKLADAVAHTSPEAIILFGGVTEAGKYIFEPTKRWMEYYLFPVFRNKVKLLKSGLPQNYAAILGAAALVWNELEKQ